MTAATMEIEISRDALRALGAIGIASILLTVGLVGWANSPRDGEGSVLLLSPQRRAVLRYLTASRGWVRRLRDVAERLDGLMPAQVAPATASTPTQPDSQPGDLYRRSREAQDARDALEQLAREIERRQVPEPLVGLHELVLVALEAHLEWVDATLRYVGAPEEVTSEELTALRAGAYAALGRLEEVSANDE